MAPPPEYDKEPKAPDKSVTSDNCEETKTICNSSSEQFTNSDSKSHNNVTNTDVENNTHVGTLDDGQLRALLDEAITYKCPKDREGKSSLFKELLEEVEQDEQACEAAARELTGSRGKRAGKGRRQLPHSNSLQDLVAALAAESAPRRARAVPVSTRAIHGGSLPSGVDTTFLLSEEPHRGYLATVRCVNPPPLAERAAEAPAAPSAPPAPPAPSADACHRRSKPTTGVTYTARATLEIGGGRAVTTTTASNQVRTSQPPAAPPLPPRAPGGGNTRQPRGPLPNANLHGQNKPCNTMLLEQPIRNEASHAFLEVFERNLANLSDSNEEVEDLNVTQKADGALAKTKQLETRSWRNSARKIQKQKKTRHSPGEISRGRKKSGLDKKCLQSIKLGNISNTEVVSKGFDKDVRERATGSSSAVKKDESSNLESNKNSYQSHHKTLPKEPNTQTHNLKYHGKEKQKAYPKREEWLANINTWYEELQTNSLMHSALRPKKSSMAVSNEETPRNLNKSLRESNTRPSINTNNTAMGAGVCSTCEEVSFPLKRSDFPLRKDKQKRQNEEDETLKVYLRVNNLISGKKNDDKCSLAEQIKYRKHVGKNLKAPSLSDINPKNVKSMTIGKQPAAATQPAPGSSNIFYDNLKYLYNKSKSKEIDKEIKLKTNDKDPKITLKGSVSSVVEKSEDLSRKISNKSDNCDKIVDKKQAKNKPESINVKCESDNNLQKSKKDTMCDIELNHKETQSVATTEVQNIDLEVQSKSNVETNRDEIELIDMRPKIEGTSLTSLKNTEIELKDISTQSQTIRKTHSFSDYYADQERLFNILESNNPNSNLPINNLDKKKSEKVHKLKTVTSKDDYVKQGANIQDVTNVPKSLEQTEIVEAKETTEDSTSISKDCENSEKDSESQTKAPPKIPEKTQLSSSEPAKPSEEPYILSELSNNACYFLTLPQCLLTDKKDDPSEVSNNNIKQYDSGESSKSSGKKAKPPETPNKMVIDKNVLRNLLCVTLFHSIAENSKPGLATINEVEVDSAIPFNCITTPEVVASCNTTSTTQSAATVDPKPLQLGSCYRAVASLTGPPAPPAHPPQNNNHNDESATSPGMNGLPVSRASDDEYKKSLDENGNSVGGVSPSAGGKKQRRKRSSRNETVTKSHHIDGYQGNKDLNELLRFIEASAPPRPRRKPPPDPRDKKRRRKPSTGVLQRAASLESVAAPPDPPPPEPEPEPSAAGFTTVSRRRRSRRKNLSPSPPPEPKIEKTVTVNSGVNVTVNVKPVVVPDLIESHRVCVSKPAPPARRPDVLTARRAPVQLPRAPPPPPGLRFGFDVNETLLPPASPPSPPPPARAAPPPQLAALVDYIGHAWEDVIKCLGGKVRYYSE